MKKSLCSKVKLRERGEILFAHRYKFTHSGRWRRLHRALKRGEVLVVETSKEGKLFRVVGDNIQL
jgi:hypothetical protein